MSTSQPPLAPDDAIDLHLHTRYSDGTWIPGELFETLAQGGFQAVSVVDHDQLAHLPEMFALGQSAGIRVIAGTEVTTEWRGLPAHLLCYAPAPHGFIGDELGHLVERTVAQMRANTRMIYDGFVARGYAFPQQSELLSAQGGEVIRAMDVGRLLIAHGYASGPAEAFQMVRDGGYAQARAPLDLAISAAHASGALCVLAHPGRGESEIHRYEPGEIEAMTNDVPLDGVEVYYPTHTAEQVVDYEAVARRLGLLVSAGSDSHGPGKRLPVTFPAQVVATLLERLGVSVQCD